MQNKKNCNEKAGYILRYVTRQLFRHLSVRTISIKIINYGGSILANLNNKMQTKQHAMKTPHSYSFTKDYFCGGRILN